MENISTQHAGDVLLFAGGEPGMEEVSLRTPQDTSALPPGQICVRAEDEAGTVDLCEEQVRQAA